MTERETLRNGKGAIVGYLETRQDEIVLRGAKNQRLGTYSLISKRAISENGKILGNSPNVLMTLLCDQ